MRRVVLVLVAVSPMVSSSSAAAADCMPARATFVAKSAQAELYWVKGGGVVKRRYFGCVAGRKPVLLTQDVAAKTASDTSYANTSFRLGGTWAGWVETTASSAGTGESSTAIHLRSLAGVKRQVDVFVSAGAQSFGRVAALKAGSDGALAFVLAKGGGVSEVDGVARDAGLPVALAYGEGIDAASLRLGGGQVGFTQAGRTRSVPLAEPAPEPAGNAAGPQGLDGRFGDCGTLVPAAVKPNIATAATRLALAPGGQIVAAGTTTSGKGPSLRADRIVVARFSADGRFDGSFGTGGTAVVTAPGGGQGEDVTVSGLVVQPDGKVVVAEDAQVGSPLHVEGILLRLDASGRLDPSFGSGGVVRSAIPATVSGSIDRLALAPDGGLIAAGARDRRWYVARFRPDGTRDPAFGTAGLVADTGTRDSVAGAVAVGADGTIAAAGAVGDAPLLVRLSATGTVLSTTSAAPAAASELLALRVLPDGSYAAAGAASNIAGDNQLLLAHYGADGTPDTGFGAAGFAIDRQVGGARDIAADADGHWLVTAPFSFSGDGLLRYTAAGARDGGFGFRGAIGGITSYGMTDNDILVGAGGTVFVAQANGLAFAVSRYAAGEPALGATAREPSVCALLVAAKLRPAQIAASRKLGVGLRLRKPGRVHLHATVTVGGRTVTLGDTTFSRSEDEAVVATLAVTKAAARLLRGAPKARIAITGGAPGGAVRRYAITLTAPRSRRAG